MRNPFKRTPPATAGRPYLHVPLPKSYAECGDELSWKIMVYDTLHTAADAMGNELFGAPETDAMDLPAAETA